MAHRHCAADGWVYCCAVTDAWNCRVVGWPIAEHIRTELVADAFQMARCNVVHRPGR